jgi:hypothetical protein
MAKIDGIDPNQVLNARIAAEMMANASTPTFEALLEKIDPISKKGYPSMHATIPDKCNDDELLRTVSILRGRGFVVTQGTSNKRELKIAWATE